MPLDPALAWVSRLVLAALLGAAAAHKARDLPRFAAVLAAYRLLPACLVVPAAAALAAAEGATAVALLLPVAPRAGAGAALALLLLYTLAIAVNLARGRREIDCGCSFGRGAQPLSGWLLVRNALLAALGLGAVLPAAARPLGPPDLAVAGLGAASLLLLYQGAHSLLENRAALRARGW